MARANNNKQGQQLGLSSGAGLLIIGLGIGWLAGLSLSPVISVVITSVVAAAAAIIAVLGGVKEEAAGGEGSAASPANRLWMRQVTPWPLAILMIGIVAGGTIGLYVRVNNLLGQEPAPSATTWMDSKEELADEIEMWTAQELDKAYVANKLFEFKFAQEAATAGSLAGSNGGDSGGSQSGFFGVTAEECSSIPGSEADYDYVLDWLSADGRSEDLTILANANITTDPEVLKDIISLLCVLDGKSAN